MEIEHTKASSIWSWYKSRSYHVLLSSFMTIFEVYSEKFKHYKLTNPIDLSTTIEVYFFTSNMTIILQINQITV